MVRRSTPPAWPHGGLELILIEQGQWTVTARNRKRERGSCKRVQNLFDSRLQPGARLAGFLCLKIEDCIFDFRREHPAVIERTAYRQEILRKLKASPIARAAAWEADR